MELGLKRSSEIIYCHQFQNAHYFTFRHHWYQPHVTVWSDQGARELSLPAHVHQSLWNECQGLRRTSKRWWWSYPFKDFWWFRIQWNIIVQSVHLLQQRRMKVIEVKRFALIHKAGWVKLESRSEFHSQFSSKGRANGKKVSRTWL